MNALILVIILQLVAVLLVIAEVIIPSGGIISVAAAGVLGYSLYLVFQDVSTGAGMIFIGIDIIVFPLLVLVGLRLLAASPASLNKKLSRSEGVVAQAPGLETYFGRSGVAMTALHPAGIALIDGTRLDVISRGEYLEQNTPVEVIAVTGNQVIVRKREQTEPLHSDQPQPGENHGV
jgi:membrane-bound ClpP family serine protease